MLISHRLRLLGWGLSLSLWLSWSAATAASAAAKIKVAAVGASTTLGSGSTAGHHFPDELGRLLGADYDVHNYGVSAAGVLRKAMVSYWNTKEFAAAKALLPDLVVFWLGGSDTKPENWEANQASFLTDMVDMIHVFQILPSHPKVVVLLSVAYHDAEGVRKALVEGQVQPRQRQAAAMTGCLVVDLQAAVAAHGEYFPDGVHPNDAGTLAIAKAAYPVVLAAQQGNVDGGAPGTDPGATDAGGATGGTSGADTGGAAGADASGGAGGSGAIDAGPAGGSSGGASGGGGGASGEGSGGSSGSNRGGSPGAGSGGTSGGSSGGSSSSGSGTAAGSSGGCDLGGGFAAGGSAAGVGGLVLMLALALAGRRRRRG